MSGCEQCGCHELQTCYCNADEVVQLVAGFFHNDHKKIRLWFSSPNPLLGGLAPNTMIAMGRRDKLLKFIKQQLDENER